MLIYSLATMSSQLFMALILGLQLTSIKVTPTPVLSPLSFRTGTTSSPLATTKIRRKTSIRPTPFRLIAVSPGNSSREAARTLTPAATPSIPKEETAPPVETSVTLQLGKSACPRVARPSSAPPASPQAAPAASPSPRTASHSTHRGTAIPASLCSISSAAGSAP